MPREIVNHALQQAEKNLVLHGQDPAHDMRIQGTRVHFATAGAAVMIVDTENNRYRDSTAQDLFDLARIADSCEHIHIFQRMCVLRDIADNYEMDLNTLYCSVMGLAQVFIAAATSVALAADSHTTVPTRSVETFASTEACNCTRAPSASPTDARALA